MVFIKRLSTLLFLDSAYFPSHSCGIVLTPDYNFRTVTNADCDLIFSNELPTILELQINGTQLTNTSFLIVSAYGSYCTYCKKR